MKSRLIIILLFSALSPVFAQTDYNQKQSLHTFIYTLNNDYFFEIINQKNKKIDFKRLSNQGIRI